MMRKPLRWTGVGLVGLMSLACASRAMSQPKGETRTYEVGSALFDSGGAGPMPAPGTPIEPPTRGEGDPVAAPVPLEESPAARRLLASIQQALPANAHATARLSGTTLTLTADPQTHEAVSRLLLAMSRAMSTVTVEVRVISLNPQAIASLPPSVREAVALATHRRESTPTLSDGQVQDLLTSAANIPETEVVAAPKLTLFSGVSGRICLGTYDTYTTAYTPNHEPVRSPVYSGIGVHVLATTSSPPIGDGDKQTPAVAVNLAVSRSTTSVVEAPWEASPKGKVLQTQRPVRSVETANALLSLRPGETALLPLKGEQGSTSIALVMATARAAEGP
jgi:hypothetical protein